MQKSNTKIIIALFSTFLLPMIFAGYLYYRGTPIGEPTNHGTLITPPIEATGLFEKLPHKWTLIWFNPNSCHDNDCLDILHELNQIRKAMGKYQNNLQIAVLTLPANNHDKLLQKILDANTQLISNAISAEKYDETLKEHSSIGMIYLMDPHDFIMMKYAQNAEPMDILKDVSKLLKNSE